MNWYNLLDKFSMVGAVSSIIVSVISSLMFYKEVNHPKNSDKLIGETSLIKLLTVSFTAVILTFLFGFISIILKILSYK